MTGALVAGIGTADRRDDGVGRVVASSAARRAGISAQARFALFAAPLDLIASWEGAELVVVVDAIRSGRAPGTVLTVPFAGLELGGARPSSTHGLGVAETLRLAAALGRAPRHGFLVGIAGEEFGPGRGLSARVESAVPEAVDRVRELLSQGRPCA